MDQMDHFANHLQAMKTPGNSTSSSQNEEYASPPRSSGSDWEKSLDEDLQMQKTLRRHLNLLLLQPEQHQLSEVITTPVFAMPVLKQASAMLLPDPSEAFPQYGLLAGMSDVLHRTLLSNDTLTKMVAEDPRLFFNIAEPSSTFICGSQGSGKSHTLSCLLENCLFASDANKLPNPLSGLVFHYDTFISDLRGSPCEVAFLASNPDIRVTVLCAPTNFRTAQRTYGSLGLGIEIEPLRIREQDLNTKRMLDLMAVTQGDGPMPLYLHAIYRILRDMRMAQQETEASFSYEEFKRRVSETPMTPAQLGPLQQRLDTLESFMPIPTPAKLVRGRMTHMVEPGTDWTNKPGHLTIVDLSCPCVTPEGACSLFNICLSIFLEHKGEAGRIIALDEAHKYMNASTEADTLTATLLSTIRLQRHLGARIVISTQEPTISPALLDLSSITIVHRFTSPEWLRSLKQHLAAAAVDLIDKTTAQIGADENADISATEAGKNKGTNHIFSEIVNLRVGEALLFSPSAIVGLEGVGRAARFKKLGTGYMKIKVRGRLTIDGGKSEIAR